MEACTPSTFHACAQPRHVSSTELKLRSSGTLCFIPEVSLGLAQARRNRNIVKKCRSVENLSQIRAYRSGAEPRHPAGMSSRNPRGMSVLRTPTEGMVHDSSDIEDNSSSDLATEWLIGTRLAAMGPLLVRRRHASSLRLPGQGPCARTHGIKHP